MRVVVEGVGGGGGSTARALAAVGEDIVVSGLKTDRKVRMGEESRRWIIVHESWKLIATMSVL